MNLRRLDLNLLTIFEAVYEERSQQRAAERLFMTQPAVSNAISRLKYHVDDPLFIKQGRTLYPTPRADELYQWIHAGLSSVRQGLSVNEQYQPANDRRAVELGMSLGGGWHGGDLYRRLSAESPGIHLIIHSVDPPEDLPGWLHDRRLDMAVHHARFDDPRLDQTVLSRYSLQLVARRGHPRLGGDAGEGHLPDPGVLWSERFAVLRDAFANPVLRDAVPLRQLLDGRIGFETSNVLTHLAAVSSTDLVGVTSTTLARQLGDRFHLITHPLPWVLPSTPLYLIMRRADRHDARLKWLWDCLVDVFSEDSSA